MPSALMTTASTGFSLPASRRGRRRASATSSAGRGHGRHEEDDRRRRPAGRRAGAGSACRVRRRGRAAEHVDRVRDARLGREELRASAARVSSAELGQLEAGSLARVGAEDAEAARVRQHGDARPFGSGWRREERGDVDQLLERGRADHARLVEERVDRGLGAGERGRVRARGALPGRGRAALQRQDRLRARDAAGEAAEAARVAERLDVHEHDVGRVVVLPPLEQVVGRDVGLVADRDEGGEAEPARLGRLEQREPERAALGGEADVAAAAPSGRRRSRSGSGRRRRCRGSSGPISRAPCARTSASSRSWRSTPSLPISAKPAEMTTRARTPLRSACSAASSTAAPGQRDDGEVDRRRGSPRSSGTPRTPATGSPSRLTG